MAKARGKARGLLKKKSYYGKDKDSERTTMTESRNSQREREEAAALERNEGSCPSFSEPFPNFLLLLVPDFTSLGIGRQTVCFLSDHPTLCPAHNRPRKSFFQPSL